MSNKPAEGIDTAVAAAVFYRDMHIRNLTDDILMMEIEKLQKQFSVPHSKIKALKNKRAEIANATYEAQETLSMAKDSRNWPMTNEKPAITNDVDVDAVVNAAVNERDDLKRILLEKKERMMFEYIQTPIY